MPALTQGSTYLFVLAARKDGLIWDLTSATVQFILRDPDGNESTKNATIFNATAGIARYAMPTTDLDETDDSNKPYKWARRWVITDGSIVQRSHWIEFSVPD